MPGLFDNLGQALLITVVVAVIAVIVYFVYQNILQRTSLWREDRRLPLGAEQGRSD